MQVSGSNQGICHFPFNIYHFSFTQNQKRQSSMRDLQCSMVIAQCQTVNTLALVSDLAANKRAPEYHAPKKGGVIQGLNKGGCLND